MQRRWLKAAPGALAMGLFLLSAASAWGAQNSVQVPTASPLGGLQLINDLNAAALNYITLDSGASAPTASALGTTGTANVIWQDTASGAIKVRNSADTAWIRAIDLDQTNAVATPDIPVLAGSTGLSAGQNEHYGEFGATAAHGFTLAQTSTLWNGFALSIFAEAGAASVSINGSDAINGGAAGAGVTIPAGYVGEFRTDGAGNWYLHQQPSILGTGSIASAGTTDIGSIANPFVTITGTTTITSLGSSCQAGQSKIVKFAGALTLTYNATALIVPGAANITTAAGDTAIDVCLGSGNHLIAGYQPASGGSVVAGGVPPPASLASSAALSQPVASASATITAGAVIVSSSGLSGGIDQLLTGYSQTFNGTGTGAGGMDTGAIPSAGYLDLYAIAKAGGTGVSILGCADATCNGSAVYSGSNMPSGYSLSGLLGIVPTNATPAIKAGMLHGRYWAYLGNACVAIFTGTTGPSSFTKVSISAGVPPEANAVKVMMGNTGASTLNWLVSPDAAGTDAGDWSVYADEGNSAPCGIGSNLNGVLTTSIVTPQAIWWQDGNTRGNSEMYVAGYWIPGIQ